MGSRAVIGLLASLVLIVLLLVNAPARLVLQLLPGEQLVLQGVSGTLWRGSAARAMAATGGGWLHLGQLHWRLSALSLLSLSPRVELDSEWGRQRLNTQLILHSGDELELADMDAVLDAELLRQYLPVSLVGSIALQFNRLVLLDGLPREAEGRLVWQDGGWHSPQGRRGLGTYAVDVSNEEAGGIRGDIVTLAGDVVATGQAVLKNNGYELEVLVSGAGLEDPQLRQALQLVATPEDGAYRVVMEGEL